MSTANFTSGNRYDNARFIASTAGNTQVIVTDRSPCVMSVASTNAARMFTTSAS